ncbi:MAG TPA: hypothetical protein VLH58_09440 [Candidatus Methylomirabilis sp.]|nr:hypothetical protein [Candidatus Methylomirabilis sp.]
MERTRRRLTSAAAARRRLCLCLLLLAPVLAGSSGAWAGEPPEGRPLNVWPFYDERNDPVERTHDRSGLGPIVDSQRALDGSTEDFAIRPFFHLRQERQLDKLEWEALYPLMSYSRSGRDWEFQFLHLLNLRAEGSQPTERERRADFFPFYMSGTSETGETYHAVLPFGGRILGGRIFGQDEMDFVMFPLYARFVKLGVETRYLPWPLISWTRGEGRSGFRVVPLYGQERKEGVFEKRFVLWPIFLHQRTGLDGETPEETLTFFPLYVSQRSKLRDSTTVLWPLFTYTDDREHQYWQWDVAWPLIRIARGEGRTANRFLPLYMREERVLRHEFLLKEMRSTDIAFLFPIYVRNQIEFPDSLKVRDRLLWWLYSDERETGRDGSTRRIDAWPLFRYTRDREGRIEFQTLALLEAFQPGNEKVEQNYSPLWALYTYRRNPEGDAVRSFLWNLVRHEETGAGRSIEILGPTLAYREGGEGAQLSLLGGLLQYEVRHGVRSVRLFRDLTFSWTAPPQPVAALPPTGGAR